MQKPSDQILWSWYVVQQQQEIYSEMAPFLAELNGVMQGGSRKNLTDRIILLSSNASHKIHQAASFRDRDDQKPQIPSMSPISIDTVLILDPMRKYAKIPNDISLVGLLPNISIHTSIQKIKRNNN